MEILIISGMSGGGKSKAASFLEDMGFYIVDNMPAGMILKFAEFCSAGTLPAGHGSPSLRPYGTYSTPRPHGGIPLP